LYTNIPHKDGLQAITNTIQDKEESNIITTLCDFVLSHNYFSFHNKNYHQINGTTMGTHMAPQYANIFMADLKQHFLSHCTQKPLLSLRYIDDIFLIWTHGEESLKNSTRTSIVFTQTSTSPWNNPHNIFHPEHTTKSIIYSQALRYNRICSDTQVTDSKLRDLQDAFLRLQYPPHMIKERINKARCIPRDNLLHDRSKAPNDRTSLIITRNLNYLQPVLDKNTSLSKALGGNPILAYRQPPNLKQILMTTRLENSNMDNGIKPCHKP
ncbi:hypothetical protein JRQ81_005850, partial [Phrynocephalus forsythii]